MEKIGNVLLDTSCYPGEDLYSDGAIEDRILDLVGKYPPAQYNQVIAKEQDWAVMYHLAKEREHILSWYPFEEGAKILEIGSGCGAVTGAVAAKANSVTCIDLSHKRSTINAVRNKGRDNLTICVGNFQDIEKGLDQDFDYATLIGVFEYGKGYIGGEKPYHGFLDSIMGHLKPGGKLLIAIENKFGLKYWAGCTEDHVGAFFEGLEGYPGTEGVRTFTKPELIEILEECGYTDYQFYYPYPDYKFPTAIYSDGRLPKRGELDRNICNFDRKRFVLMDEGKVFDQILDNGLFPLYSNSFFLEVTKEGGGKEAKGKVLYTKYSSGRAPEFALRTCITKAGAEIAFSKVAESQQGQALIQSIVKKMEKLQEIWKQKGLFQVNKCWLEDGNVCFEYLEGITLEEKLDKFVEDGELQTAVQWIKKAAGRIKDAASVQEFSMTPEFQQVFGDVAFPWQEQAAEAADIDLIFSNLLLAGDGAWHVLDYEWTFSFPVPVGYLVYRALHYYLEAAPKRKKLKEELNLYESLGITEEKKKVYQKMEQGFQAYIAGGYVSVGELYHRMGKKAIPLGEVLQETDKRRAQAYIDYGQGFSESNSFFIEQGFEEDVSYTVSLPEGAVGAWVDPALSACILKDVSLAWEGGLPVKYTTTGYEMEKNCYLFDNSDPKIIIEEIPVGKHKIEISYRISILEGQTARMLMDKVNTKGRMKKKVRGLIRG